MPSKERTADRGSRKARNIIVTSGTDLRTARVASGLSLEDVGRAVGLSYSQVGRIERGEHPSVTIVQLAKISAVVGLDISVRFYPGGSPLRDTAHIALLERFRGRLSPALTFRTEVPLPGPGELRAWDGMVFGAGDPSGVEAETRIYDFQALERRVALKARDGNVSRVILVVAATRRNRLAVREARASLAVASRSRATSPSRHSLRVATPADPPWSCCDRPLPTAGPDGPPGTAALTVRTDLDAGGNAGACASGAHV